MKCMLVTKVLIVLCLALKVNCGAAPINKPKIQTPTYSNPHLPKKCLTTVKIYGDCAESLKPESLKEYMTLVSTNKITKFDTSVCYLPRVKGERCSNVGRTPRILWYWKASLKICRPFQYLGCNGNENQFDTKEMCIDRCHILSKKNYIDKIEYDQVQIKEVAKTNENVGEARIGTTELSNKSRQNNLLELEDETKDMCLLEKEVGLCRALIPRYFYNHKSARCESFDYGGCGGNANNFKTFNECQLNCKSASSKQQSQNVCALKPETGPCEAIQLRYYYNQEKKSCQKFVYGGCAGNGNRFKTAKECFKQCTQDHMEK